MIWSPTILNEDCTLTVQDCNGSTNRRFGFFDEDEEEEEEED